MIRRFLLPFAWLLLVWVLLWGGLSVANLVSGVVVVAGILLFFPLAAAARQGRLRPVRAISFVFFFVWELLKATWVVAWEIVTPGRGYTPGIICTEVRGVSDALITLVANFITLTPGTMTLEIRHRPTRLYIHVLHLRDPEQARRDVLRLEARAIRAFGTREAIALLTADATESSAPPPDEGGGS
ncbi:MAG: Na+/H+ antiporter subunit E [Acidimicrobiia bacterium]